MLCIGLLIFLSGHIWNIRIEGNRQCSTGEILEFLADQGITHGISRKKINCSEIAAAVREKYPEITWVSAKLEGTRLTLEVQEGIFTGDDMPKEQTASSLAAEKDGTIVKMVTRAGVPLLYPGDTCKKGDILVSGVLELKNDSQEVYQYQYVKADADVYIQYKLAYYHEVPMEYQEEVFAGTEKRAAVSGWETGSLLSGERKKTDGNNLLNIIPGR